MASDYEYKPKENLNFFQNYDAHLNYLKDDFTDIQNKMCDHYYSLADRFEILGEELLKRITITKRLRDAHDYFDEVLGATVLPPLALGYSIYNLFASLWEGILILVMHCSESDLESNDDYHEHHQNAQNYLFMSLAALALSVESLLKSIIALVSRPIVTLIDGFKDQNKYRFLYDESMEKDYGNLNESHSYNS